MAHVVPSGTFDFPRGAGHKLAPHGDNLSSNFLPFGSGVLALELISWWWR